MNASVALEYTGFTDLMLSWGFASFLGDPGRSVQLTPQSDMAKVCSLNAGAQDTSGCHRTYFVAGDSLFVVPELLVDESVPDADIILTTNHRGYLLDFNAGDSTKNFNETSECRTYSSRYLSFQVGAVRLCVGNSGPSELEARKKAHPYSFVK